MVDFNTDRFEIKKDEKGLFDRCKGNYRFIPVKVLKDKPRNN